MGFWRRLIGRRTEFQDSETALLEIAMGGRKGKTTLSGYPKCCFCGAKFPIPAARLRAESDGQAVFMCPECGRMNGIG